VRAHV